MLRIVRTPDGQVCLDLTGKLPGRGAYVCLKRECVLSAEKRDALSKSLKTGVPRELYGEIMKQLPPGGECDEP